MIENSKKTYVIIVGIIIISTIVLVFLIQWIGKKAEEKIQVTTETDVLANKIEEYTQKREDGTKVNISTKLHEMKKLGDLEIGNITLTSKNNISVILADAKNTGNNTSKLTEIILILLDKNGNEIVSANGIIPQLKENETTQINIGISADFANAYDFIIRAK